jgi:dihydroorotase
MSDEAGTAPEFTVHGGRLLGAEDDEPRDVVIAGGEIAALREVFSRDALAAGSFDATSLLLVPGPIDAAVTLPATAADSLAAAAAALGRSGRSLAIDRGAARDESLAARAQALRRTLAPRLAFLANPPRSGDGAAATEGAIGLALCGARDQSLDVAAFDRWFAVAARLDKTLVVDPSAAIVALRIGSSRTAAAEGARLAPSLEAEGCRRSSERAKREGTRLLIAPISSLAALEAVREARRRSVAVALATTPRYLRFVRRASRRGEPAAPSPPLRGELDREALREAVAGGEIELLVSDWREGDGDDDFVADLLMLRREGVLGDAALLERCRAAPARLFGLPATRELRVGAAADFSVYDDRRPGAPRRVAVFRDGTRVH